MPAHIAVIVTAAAFIVGGLLGYNHGKKVQRGEAADETVTAFQTLIDHHNKLLQASTEAAVKAEAERQAYKRQALERKNRVLQDALAKANPVCDRDAESFSLLLESIRAANGSVTPASGPVSDPVR